MKLVMHNPARNFFDSDPYLNQLRGDLFPALAHKKTAWPKVNIVETDNEYTLMAEVPGMTEKDIDIEMKDGILSLRGKKALAQTEGTVHVQEIGSWDFDRDFRLGEQVDAEKVTARLEHGVLYISLGKKEKAKPKKVEINIAS